MRWDDYKIDHWIYTNTNQIVIPGDLLDLCRWLTDVYEYSAYAIIGLRL